jgi:hypothetical protein
LKPYKVEYVCCMGVLVHISLTQLLCLYIIKWMHQPVFAKRVIFLLGV